MSRSAGRCVLPRVSPPGLASRTSGPRSRWTPTPFLPERPPDSRDPAALAPPRSALPPRVASARGGAVPRPHDSPRAGVRTARRPALASCAESSRAAPAASRPPAGLGSEPHRPSPRLCFRSPGEKQPEKTNQAAQSSPPQCGLAHVRVGENMHAAACERHRTCKRCRDLNTRRGDAQL